MPLAVPRGHTQFSWSAGTTCPPGHTPFSWSSTLLWSLDEYRPTKKKPVFDFKRALAIRKLKNLDGEPVRVDAGIFIGSIGAAQSSDNLRRQGITHVLCLGSNMPAQFPDEFKYKTVEVDDKPKSRILDHLGACIEFIDEARVEGAVLVHCFQGKSRSVSIIVGYQMAKRKITFLSALDAVRERRPGAQPNAGFAAELLAFQRRGFAL